MKNICLIEARTDLGVHIDGTNLGPKKIAKNFDFKKIIINKKNVNKSKNKNNLQKNLNEINIFSSKIFEAVSTCFQKDLFPITIGGDHSCVIGSILSSQHFYKNIGIIWIDAHADYNTFETTITGNIHGLPLAAVTGYKCKKLTQFLSNNYINPENCVIVGGRSIDKLEKDNLKDAKITLFTTEDIKTEGASSIIKKAIKIASNKTNGIHISYDIDIIDPNEAPGVSIPEKNGISKIDAYNIMDEVLNNYNLIKSFDIVEYNPTLDIDDKTLKIATELLNKIIEK